MISALLNFLLYPIHIWTMPREMLSFWDQCFMTGEMMLGIAVVGWVWCFLKTRLRQAWAVCTRKRYLDFEFHSPSFYLPSGE